MFKRKKLPDADEIMHEHHGWDGPLFDIPTNIEPTKDQDIINWLRGENAYLRGKIYAYEKFLKDKEYIKEDDVQEKEN